MKGLNYFQVCQMFSNYVFVFSQVYTFRPKVVQIPVRNTNQYKICKFRRAIFSTFYNISQPNLAVLLILTCSF
jgi:hypothetical protein